MSDKLTSPTKRTKLRHPRTPVACAFCKKRKVRCSGSLPCNVCRENEVSCEYPASALPTGLVQNRKGSSHNISHIRTETVAANVSEQPTTSQVAGKTSGPQDGFAPSIAVDLGAGTSFLYHALNDSEGAEDGRQSVSIGMDRNASLASLTSYGDAPTTILQLAPLQRPFHHFDGISYLVEQYFQYICPTYRFLHQPTVERWTRNYVSEHQMTSSKQACLLLVCAQTLLHDKHLERSNQTAKEMSEGCFQRAKALLLDEPGPPTLSSVQARLALCLYLLSTFRLTECRFCFSFAITIAMSLRLHRAEHDQRDSLLTIECRKRVFWSAYILDGYLSVMLGQPKLLRDEDLDQKFPQNIDDRDLDSDIPVEHLPRHGNIEAFTAHAKLAQLMAWSNARLYPPKSLGIEQALERSSETLDALENWRKELPDFLKPRDRTFTGLRTFERQNTILKLASAHVQILASRKSILFEKSAEETSASTARTVHDTLQACLTAVSTVLSTVDVLIQHGQCYEAFWTTQYIGLVALSTLYVYIIRSEQDALSVKLSSEYEINESFGLALKCHKHLAKLAPSRSHAEKHHVLLARLRDTASKARKKAQRDQEALQASIHLQPQSVYNLEIPQVYNDAGPAQISATQLIDDSNTPLSASETLDWTFDLPEFAWSNFDVIG